MFICCTHKKKDAFEQAKEESILKDKIAKLLYQEGYKFVIAESK